MTRESLVEIQFWIYTALWKCIQFHWSNVVHSFTHIFWISRNEFIVSVQSSNWYFVGSRISNTRIKYSSFHFGILAYGTIFTVIQNAIRHLALFFMKWIVITFNYLMPFYYISVYNGLNAVCIVEMCAW